MTAPLLVVELIATTALAVPAARAARGYLATHDHTPTRAVSTLAQVLLTAAAASATLALAATIGHALHAATILPAIAPAIAATTVDAHAHRLPNTLIAAIAALAGTGTITAAVATHSPALLVSALAGALAVGLGGLVMVLTGASLGMGDVKLATALALSLGAWGWYLPVVAVVGALALSVPEAIAGLLKGRRHTHLALGPYLTFAALIVTALAYVACSSMSPAPW